MSSMEGVAIEHVLAEASATTAPPKGMPPQEWVRKNLFNSVLNSVITIVLVVAIGFLAVRGAQWAIAEDWLIIRRNLRNFMLGQFPRDELWRPWAAGITLVTATGLGTAALARNAYDDAIEKGLPAFRPTWPDLIRRFWAVLAFVVLVLAFTRTLEPTIWVLVTAALFVAAREAGWRLPAGLRRLAAFILGFGAVVFFTILAGSGGLVAVVAGLVTAPFVSALLSGRVTRRSTAGRLAAVAAPVVAGVAVYGVMSAIDSSGFGWNDWGGLYLTLFTTVVGIATGMPLGILLAIGRRSELPVIKAFSVLFIEFVRGVPLISLLLFSNIILPLLFPLDVGIPDTTTRAMIVITLFSAAYIAEIVRGGLQAVPKGQTEAAQAQGLSAGKIQRLIVMPQALRAVIPAMVGQFISLFKDTSLLAIIGVAEFFQYAAIANGQPEFLGQELQLVTYAFVAVGYWSFAYTMSKESRRLEVKLGVGVR